ncbi:glycosyl hydrolase family 31 protein [Phlyctema vagabunda]|uniref:Probable alpha/beta-glucosidase agdC n=1 Tax=Phlyctema vagabunda TaxID=108571 RepID=A0ABR4PI75_9HELO
MAKWFPWVLAATAVTVATAQNNTTLPLDKCPGYKASNVQTSASGLTADLSLAGRACNVYGDDLLNLTLMVEYQTHDRIHVLIQDAANVVYQIPSSVLPRPSSTQGSTTATSNIHFNYTTSPFSFSISRKSTGEVLFDTSAANLVFESQYLRLRTSLPDDPNLYGLGEHSDSFRLNTTDYVRTLWVQDAYNIPVDTNLYGSHPIYFEHRVSGSHGVFLLNSNGMDVKINNTGSTGSQYLEYNTLGGVLDLYFLAGPTPVEVSRQFSEVVGLPAMMPYWSLGFQQCRYGYQDAYEVAEVIYNYSKAEIPLEVMWTDIDYMNLRQVFTLDPDRYPIDMMQAINHYLHDHDQKQILMVDPGLAYIDNPPYQRGAADDIFLKRDNGSYWLGVVWPGVTVFPDWFNSNIQKYWDNEFAIFFDPDTGVDVDGLWLDMNEPSNFPCLFPCDNPYASAVGFPPTPPAIRTPPRPLPGFPCSFQPPGSNCSDAKRAAIARDSPAQNQVEERQETGQALGLPGRDLLYPKYAIHNRAAFTVEDNAAGGGISNKTVNTDVIHENGLAMYDTHNLYGSMMATSSYGAMLARRPVERPFVISRSTFAGAGTKTGHWLGDNGSTWWHYIASIRTMISFTSIYQVPMTGSDVCGYDGNTNEQLCARWATLGAFQPFYRNHQGFPPNIPQEFYRWESVTRAAKKAIDIRYRLLDYIYTAMYLQSVDGTPLLSPPFYLYPSDPNTFAIETQYFYGTGLLVSPVTAEDSTSVTVYFPVGRFYDFYTHALVSSQAHEMLLEDIDYESIALHYRGGSILPLRVNSSMTTTELRTQDFELVVALDENQQAKGGLYLDDGLSVEVQGKTLVEFTFQAGVLRMSAQQGYGFATLNKIQKVVILGYDGAATGWSVARGASGSLAKDAISGEAVIEELGLGLNADFELVLS